MLLNKTKIISRAKTWSPICGIYILIKEDKIVYVGKSENVLGRLASHWTTKAFDFDKYHIVECKRTSLAMLEAAYIETLNPTYNQIRNKVHVPWPC